MAFKTSSGKLITTKYGEPYIWQSSDVTTLPSNEMIITASDGADSDQFGASVAVGNNRIVVGAYGDDDNGSTSGSAYIYNLNGTNEIKITPSDNAAADRFGQSVAIGHSRIVVGAYGDDDNGSDSGSAYIFDLAGNQLSKIIPSDGAAGDRFGVFVAIGNNKIVVGAYGDDDNGSDSGSAYIYDLDGTNEIKLIAYDATSNDFFGISVAIGNGRIVVGAPGINSFSGAAYIFDLAGNQLSKITASDGVANCSFGQSVAIGNGRIVVGAPGDNRGGYRLGSAYIFDLDGNQLAKIIDPNGLNDSEFGTSVAVGNGRIIVGQYFNQSNESICVYDLDGNQLTKINADKPADNFGALVAVGNGIIAVGAPNNARVSDGVRAGSASIYNTPSVYTAYDLIYNEV